MLEEFCFVKVESQGKKPEISRNLRNLRFFISQGKRGEVYRGTSFLVFRDLYLKVPRVFPKALKFKKFPEVKDE